MNVFEYADWRVSRQLMTEAEAAEAVAWAKLVEPQGVPKRGTGLSLKFGPVEKEGKSGYCRAGYGMARPGMAGQGRGANGARTNAVR